MNYVKRFALFWYDFVVGDDWFIAAGVGVAILVTWGLHRDGVDAWWFLPPAVIAILAVAVARANRRT